MGIIRRIDDTGFGNRLIETGPSAATVEFGITLEERVSTGGAMIGTYIFRVFKGTGKRSFCSFLPRDVIDIGRQDFLPFLLTEIHFISGIAGVNGIFGAIHG
jgi:hypothetical protein